MSTHTSTTNPRPTSDPRTIPTDDPQPPSATTADWVERCQRQFDPSRNSLLKNLTDENNEAMVPSDEDRDSKALTPSN